MWSWEEDIWEDKTFRHDKTQKLKKVKKLKYIAFKPIL